MPTITKIVEQKRTPARHAVYLDGRLAFSCSLDTVARFRLRVGLALSDDQLKAIADDTLRQECFKKATQFLSQRLHSRSELWRKLISAKHAPDVVTAVLDELIRLRYIDDERFARTKALAAAQHRYHGRRRAFVELLKSGVDAATANRALDDVYQQTDPAALARQLIQKQLPRLRRLDPLVARRRLVAMLQRRGFDYDTIKPIIDQALGDQPEPA